MKAPERPSRLKAARNRLGKVQFSVAVGMTLVWMLLFNGFQLRPESLGLLVLGFLVAVVIMLLFPMPPIDPGFRFRPIALVRMVAYILAKMVVASLSVIRQIFTSGEVRSSVMAVKLKTQSDLMLVCTAIASSIIPGTVIVEVGRDEWILYVHVLGADDEESIEQSRLDILELERQIVLALGTRKDVAALAEPAPTGEESP